MVNHHILSFMYHGKSPSNHHHFRRICFTFFQASNLSSKISKLCLTEDLQPNPPGGICHGLCQIAPGASTRKPPRGFGFHPPKPAKTDPEIMRNSWTTPKVDYEVGEDVVVWHVFGGIFRWPKIHLKQGVPSRDGNRSEWKFYKMSMPMSIPDASM